MYVRTNKGQIFDCIESEQMGKPIYYPRNSKTNGYIDYNEVYKKSDNIIDICEVGDYVNGEKVRYIKKGKDWCYLSIDDECDYIISGYDSDGWAKPIKSIVTKEQFESMEYKVGE